MKKVVVISLGGSRIIPDKIDRAFLEDFKKTLLKNKNYRFVIVCGGGSTARNYINGIEKVNLRKSKKKRLQSFLGISATRLNARFLTYFFGEDANKGIPHDMAEVESLLKKHRIVFCGALRYSKNQTSDSTAAKLARFFNSYFINLTDVTGIYDRDPKIYKSARFFPEISHKEFYKMAKMISFTPGQHFVLDQNAARVIKKYDITTYIIGEVKQLDNLLNNRHFVGTRIS